MCAWTSSASPSWGRTRSPRSSPKARRAGLRFARRLADEWACGANRFEQPGEALFIARDGGEIIGGGGLNVDPYAADPSVGRVRHVYVSAAYRRRGIGARLVSTIVAAARGRFATLRLSTSNPDAARLYERVGFRRHAGAADCTHVMLVDGAG